METLEQFELRNHKFYLSLQNAFAGGNLDGFETVGEVCIDNKKHFILREIRPPRGNGKGSNDILDSLTHREIQIVVMVSDGLVNKVIADRLNISEWTVSTHLRRIFAKLRVDSRAEMVYRCAKVIQSYKSSHQ